MMMQPPTLDYSSALPLPNSREVARVYNRLAVLLPLAGGAYPLLTYIGRELAAGPTMQTIAALLLSVDVIILLWVGVVDGYRVGKLMGDRYLTSLLPIVLILPPMFVFCLIALIVRTNRRLRAAGIRVGLLGAVAADMPAR